MALREAPNFSMTRRLQPRWGPVLFEPDYDSLRGKRHGVPFTPTTKITLGEVAAADDDLLIDDATGAELPNAETVTYTSATAGTGPLDNSDMADVVTIIDTDGNEVVVVPLGEAVAMNPMEDEQLYQMRNLVTVVTNTTVVAMTVVHTGYDCWGQKVVETHAIGAGGTSKTVNGKKAMAYWYSTAITAAGNAEGNTLKLGVGDVLGLPYRAAKKSDVLGVWFNDALDTSATVVAAVDTTPSATTGDVRGTVDPNSACDGSVVDVWVRIDPTSKVTAYGKDQYAG